MAGAGDGGGHAWARGVGSRCGRVVGVVVGV